MSHEIIINGVNRKWDSPIITKKEVGILAYKESDWYKNMLASNPLKIVPYILSMSATFKNAHPDSNKPEGIMAIGEAVRIQDGTVFNIQDTSNA